MDFMKRIAFGIAAIFLMTIFSFPAHAADQDLKIGVINIQKIISLSKVGQEAKTAVKTKFEDYQAKLKKEEDVLIGLKDEIEKKGSVWSDETRTEKEREFERRVKALQDESEYATNDMKDFEKKKVEPILQVLETIISDYGKAQKFSLIMDSGRGVIYMDEALDISAPVAAELDKKMTADK